MFRYVGGRKQVCVLRTDTLGCIRLADDSFLLVTASPMSAWSSFERFKLRKVFPRDIKVMLKFQSVLWGQTEKIIVLLKLPIYYAMKTSTRGHRWASIWTTLLLHIKGL